MFFNSSIDRTATSVPYRYSEADVGIQCNFLVRSPRAFCYAAAAASAEKSGTEVPLDGAFLADSSDVCGVMYPVTLSPAASRLAGSGSKQPEPARLARLHGERRRGGRATTLAAHSE
jgi:hypothetical protein